MTQDKIERDKKIKMLSVEADSSHQNFMSDLLSQKAETDFATSGTEALQKIAKQEYDLVICEIDLPDKKAFDLIQKTKREYPNIVIVVLSEQDNFFEAMDAIRWGASDILLKPLSIEQIVILIEKFFSMAEENQKDFFLHSCIKEEKSSYVLPTSITAMNQFIQEFIVVIKRFPNVTKDNLFAIRLSVYEMLLNAIEHGNLEVDYNEKKKLLQSSDNYFDNLQKRCALKPYRNRKIFVDYHYEPSKFSVTIKDEGKGFDVENFSQQKTANENPLSLNGRGILISKLNLDELSYNEKGNSVTIVKKLL